MRITSDALLGGVLSGKLSDGPELKNGRSGNMAVSPVDGSIVATGYFDNSTGREP